MTKIVKKKKVCLHVFFFFQNTTFSLWKCHFFIFYVCHKFLLDKFLPLNCGQTKNLDNHCLEPKESWSQTLTKDRFQNPKYFIKQKVKCSNIKQIKVSEWQQCQCPYSLSMCALVSDDCRTLTEVCPRHPPTPNMSVCTLNQSCWMIFCLHGSITSTHFIHPPHRHMWSFSTHLRVQAAAPGVWEVAEETHTMTFCVRKAIRWCVCYRCCGSSLSMQLVLRCSDKWGGTGMSWALLLNECCAGPQGLSLWRFPNPWVFNSGCARVIKQIIFN